jgi:hypothetical protein
MRGVLPSNEVQNAIGEVHQKTSLRLRSADVAMREVADSALVLISTLDMMDYDLI